MPQYGLTKEAIESGDLRIMLAVEPSGSSNNALFERTRALDDLLQIKPGQRPSLVYNVEALGRYNNLQRTIRLQHPFLKEGQEVSGPVGTYTRGTCVLAGTGKSLDFEFLKKAGELGLPIIGLGNISYGDVRIDYWIGRQDVLTYLPGPIETQRIQAFVHADYIEDGLWDPMTKSQARITASQSVNTLGYKTVSTPFEEWLKVPENITDGGYGSTFVAGLSLAVLMGFHNIVLTGIDLGGRLSDYFCFPEIPHAETVKRKLGPYTNIRRDFTGIYKACASYGIRIVGVESSPFLIPVLPIKYMERALHSVLALTRRVNPKTVKVTIPAQKKRAYLKMIRDAQNHIVSPTVLLDHAKTLMDRYPVRFNTPEARKAIEDYEAAKRRPGGCTGCLKGKVGQPVYEAFEKAIREQDQEVHKIWKELLPNHYIMKTRLMQGTVVSEMIFREDYAEEEQKWKEAQL